MGPPEQGCHPDDSPCIPHLEGDALNCGDLTAAQRPVTVRVVGVDPSQLDRAALTVYRLVRHAQVIVLKAKATDSEANVRRHPLNRRVSNRP